jgi:hypothetical protein
MVQWVLQGGEGARELRDDKEMKMRGRRCAWDILERYLGRSLEMKMLCQRTDLSSKNRKGSID